MTTIVTRAGKGSPLTNTEVDTNFTNLNSNKLETLTSTDSSVTITGTGASRDLSVPVNPNVVSGPASATNNAIALFDGTTGKLIKNSVITVDSSGNVTGINSTINQNVVGFNTSYSTPLTAGQLGWDGNNTLAIGMAGGNVIQHIGEDTFFYVKASSAITKGQVVMFTGAVGASGVITVAPATSVTNAQYIVGVAAESIALNGFGLVQNFGELRNIDTTAFADGDILYYDSTVTGGFTKTYPTSGPIVTIAAVSTGGSSNGVIQIRLSVTQRITASTGISVSQTATGTTVTNTAPDQTVSITGAGGAVVTGTYPNFTVTTPSGTVTSVSGTAPIASTGGATPTISISQASATTNGYLSSTDWNTFNNKQPAGAYLTSAVTSATGTTNQVNVSASTGAVTFSLPQSINTAASVQFGSFGVGTPASGTTGEIRATNNITAYYSSDAKFKENVQAIPNALNAVEAIGGKTFDWTDAYIKAHGGEDGYFVQKQDFGVIAQDVQAVFPQAVRTREDGSLAVDYPKLSALAFAAILELSAEVKLLKAKIG